MGRKRKPIYLKELPENVIEFVKDRYWFSLRSWNASAFLFRLISLLNILTFLNSFLNNMFLYHFIHQKQIKTSFFNVISIFWQKHIWHHSRTKVVFLKNLTHFLTFFIHRKFVLKNNVFEKVMFQFCLIICFK